MEKRMLWLGLMLMVVGLCSSGALATTMGPPVAGLDAGQFSVGLGYSTSDIGIDLDGKFTDQWEVVEVEDHIIFGITTTTTTQSPFTVERDFEDEAESDMILANLGYGVFDYLEVFVLLGMDDLSLDEGPLDSDDELAYGFGTKATLYDDGNLKFGVLIQMSWSSFDGDYTEIERIFEPDFGIDETVPTTADWEMDYYQLKFAIGPSYKLTDALSIYGGPFYHLVRGDFDIELRGEKTEVDTTLAPLVTYTDTVTYSEDISGDIEEQSNFGAYIGAQIDFAENLPFCVEYQMTGDTDILGASLVYRF